MPDQQPQSPGQPKRPFQFNLQAMFALTAACALLAGMWSWRDVMGVLQYFQGVSVCLISVGVVRRRKRLIVLGVVALAGLQLGVRFSARRTGASAGSGWCTIPIAARIVDARTGQPIPNATVRVLHGSATPSGVRTGTDGRATVDTELTFIFGRYHSIFGTGETRWVGFSGVAIEADAERYGQARVSLSEHFPERWDLTGDPLPPVTVELERAR